MINAKNWWKLQQKSLSSWANLEPCLQQFAAKSIEMLCVTGCTVNAQLITKCLLYNEMLHACRSQFLQNLHFVFLFIYSMPLTRFICCFLRSLCAVFRLINDTCELVWHAIHCAWFVKSFCRLEWRQGLSLRSAAAWGVINMPLDRDCHGIASLRHKHRVGPSRPAQASGIATEIAL